MSHWKNGGMGGGGGEILLQKNSLTPSLLQLSYYSDKCFKICQVSDAWGKKKKVHNATKKGALQMLLSRKARFIYWIDLQL